MKKMLLIALAGMLAAPLAACDMDKKGGDAMLNKSKAKASSTAAKAEKNGKTVATAKAKANKS